MVVVLLLVTALGRCRYPSSRLLAWGGAAGAIGRLGVVYLDGHPVFRHAVGVPTEMLDQVLMERGGHSHEGSEHGDPAAGGDSTDSRLEHGHVP